MAIKSSFLIAQSKLPLTIPIRWLLTKDEDDAQQKEQDDKIQANTDAIEELMQMRLTE
jgi:hypothetical protein